MREFGFKYKKMDILGYWQTQEKCNPSGFAMFQDSSIILQIFRVENIE